MIGHPIERGGFVEQNLCVFDERIGVCLGTNFSKIEQRIVVATHAITHQRTPVIRVAPMVTMRAT